MKNFIFKSEAEFHKIVFNKLEMLLNEQRHQRADLTEVKYMLHKLQNNKDLQETVDKFYKEAPNASDPDLD